MPYAYNILVCSSCLSQLGDDCWRGDADRGCSDRVGVLLGLLACQNHLSHCL